MGPKKSATEIGEIWERNVRPKIVGTESEMKTVTKNGSGMCLILLTKLALTSWLVLCLKRRDGCCAVWCVIGTRLFRFSL